MDSGHVSAALTRYFGGRRDVVAAYLFGSTARGQARPSSDVDVGVILAAGEPRSLADLDPVLAMQSDLEALLACAVDVVPMNSAPADLLHRILRDGVLVHESDPGRRIEFELQARKEYWDLLPTLQLYRRTVLGSV